MGERDLKREEIKTIAKWIIAVFLLGVGTKVLKGALENLKKVLKLRK